MAEGFRWNSTELITGLRNIDTRADRAITMAMTRHSQSGLAFAKQNAPWTDRTSNARNGLNSSVIREAARNGRGRYAMVFYHSVPYGLWLEVKYSGRYSVIKPTLDHEGPQLMRTLSGLFGSMGR